MPEPITPRRAAEILARASVIDRRLPDASADEVWASTLTIAGVDYRDCLAAVDTHYAESVEPVKPFHVIAIARRMATDRAEADANRRALAPPPDDAIPAAEGARRVMRMLAEHRARKRAAESVAGPGVPVGTNEPGSAVSGHHSGPQGHADNDGEWNWKRTADGGWYSGPDDAVTETYPGSGVFE